MNKNKLKRNIKNSNLTEESKAEAIHIIDQYGKDEVKVILLSLFKLIEIPLALIKLFCDD